MMILSRGRKIHQFHAKMRQRAVLMMGPFLLLVAAVHSSGYFISAGSLHFSTTWKRGWTSAGTTTCPSGQTSWYLPATQTGLTESNKSYQDEKVLRILKSLFLVTDACLVWAPCWLRLPWRTSRKWGWRWELFSMVFLNLSLSLLLYCVYTCEMVCICVSGNVCGLVSRHRRQCLFACKVIMV